MDDLLLAVGAVVAVVVIYVLFFYKGGLVNSMSGTKQASSAQSNTQTQGSTTAGAGRPHSTPLATSGANLHGSSPIPLQGVSGVAVPVSSKQGGSNPYSGLSALFLAHGAAGAEIPFGSGPGAGKKISPPTSPSINPQVVAQGTVGDTAGTLTEPESYGPNMLTGPQGIFSALQHTLGTIGPRPVKTTP